MACLSVCLSIELILGKDKLQALNKSLSDPVEKMIAELRPGKKWRLYLLYKQTERYINLLVDVQGHQILVNGFFQGDPHNGTCFHKFVRDIYIRFASSTYCS